MSRPSSARSRSSIVYIPKRVSTSRVSTSYRTDISSNLAASATLSWENAISDVLLVLGVW